MMLHECGSSWQVELFGVLQCRNDFMRDVRFSVLNLCSTFYFGIGLSMP